MSEQVEDKTNFTEHLLQVGSVVTYLYATRLSQIEFVHATRMRLDFYRDRVINTYAFSAM